MIFVENFTDFCRNFEKCYTIFRNSGNLQNFGKFHELLMKSCKFRKLVRRIVTSGNCLQFPEIPAKFRENFTEKTAISIDLQQNFEKAAKITKMCKKSENFEM